ncbi:hypothetical protein N9C56_00460 [Paracoccaceae bacterium]|nr:hypothetical protein [Paracoccaceae bacterium]
MYVEIHIRQCQVSHTLPVGCHVPVSTVIFSYQNAIGQEIWRRDAAICFDAMPCWHFYDGIIRLGAAVRRVW